MEGSFRENPNFLGPEIFNVTFANAGRDLTYIFETRKLRVQAECLSSIFTIAYVDTATAGCFVSNIVLYVSLAFIGGVVFIRFFIALYFGLFVGWRLGDQDKALLNTVCTNKATARKADIERKTRSRYTPKHPNDFRKQMPSNSSLNLDISLMDLSTPTLDPIMNDPSLMHTLVMVPCYSESLDSMRTTIHSIVDSD
jgi:chitin synthase